MRAVLFGAVCVCGAGSSLVACGTGSQNATGGNLDATADGSSDDGSGDDTGYDVDTVSVEPPLPRPVECEAGLTSCFGGLCVDLQTDLHHCGSCRSDCTSFRDGCANGACQPAPVTIVPADTSAPRLGLSSIVTDGANVYWTESGLASLTASGVTTLAGRVMQAPVDGGAPITLASEPLAASCTTLHIAVSGGSVFWTTPYEPDGGAGAGTVETVPVGGGTPILLASIAHGWPLTSIAVDSSRAYFAATDSITALSLDGGPPVPLVSSGGGSIAVDSVNLYWATDSVPGVVARIPLDGGAQTTIAAMQDTPSAIAVDGTTVYWATLAFPASWNINAAPSDGGPVLMLAADSPSFLIDSDSLYAWTGGDLVRTPAGGGNGSTLAVVGPGMVCGQSTAPAAPPLAVDAMNIYWVNPDGSVMKVAK
jgi:hypothetical protein